MINEFYRPPGNELLDTSVAVTLWQRARGMYSIYSYAPSNGTGREGKDGDDDTTNGYGYSCYSYSDRTTSPAPPHVPTYQTEVEDEAYLKEAEAGIELIDSVSLYLKIILHQFQ